MVVTLLGRNSVKIQAILLCLQKEAKLCSFRVRAFEWTILAGFDHAEVVNGQSFEISFCAPDSCQNWETEV